MALLVYIAFCHYPAILQIMLPKNPWDRLWAQAELAQSEGQWSEAINALRMIAKHSPRSEKSARDSLQKIVSIRNAYRNDPGPSLEYRDPRQLDSLPGKSEDPWDTIEEWRIDPEVAKWEGWINACEAWPFTGDTENFKGRYEWAETAVERPARKHRH